VKHGNDGPKDFRWVHGFSSPDNDDVAVLYDDPGGDDTFKSLPDWVLLAFWQ